MNTTQAGFWVLIFVALCFYATLVAWVYGPLT